MEHDITDMAAAERDSTTATTEGAATPATASEEHALRPVSYVSVPPNVWALARAIAAVLDESMPPPIRTITRAVDRLGPERARAVLGQALTVEAAGGLTLPDGRRRTLGGVFFHLVRASDAISREDKDDIFPPPSGHPKRTGAGTTPAPTPPRPPTPWTDNTYREIMAALQHDNAGRATTVKITVAGRP